MTAENLSDDARPAFLRYTSRERPAAQIVGICARYYEGQNKTRGKASPRMTNTRHMEVQ